MASIGIYHDRNTELFEVDYRPKQTFKPSFSFSRTEQPYVEESLSPIEYTSIEEPDPPALRRQNAFIAASQLLKGKPTSHLTRLKVLFKRLLQASYSTLDNASQIAEQYNLTLNRVFSTDNTHVYLDNLTQFPLIVHRGSYTATDWLIDDTMILTGLNRLLSSPRMIRAKEITREVEKYYNKPADTFGHSLGSVLAENSGANGYIMTYNKGSGFGDIKKTIQNDKQIDYRNKRDLISLISETQSRNNNIRYIGSGNEGLIEAHGLDILPDVANRRA